MRIGFTLSNFKEMRALLHDLPPAVEARVMRTAVGNAAKPLVKAAKSKAPVRSGALRKSITSVVRHYPKSGKVVAVIGPDKEYYAGGKRLKGRADRRGADRPANYAHLVEFGHYSRAGSEKFGGFERGFRRRKSSGARVAQEARSFILPQPFLRPAVATATPAAEAELARGVEKGIEREIKRLSKMKKVKGAR